jgi:pilus assembly protein CpaE
MLQRHGYEVSAANNGGQAIAKASAEHPDLIILDVMMPDMNGYEVCKRLRGNPDTQTIPIIMFTAKTLIDDKVAGFEAGADDYLTKPTHPAELASRVRAILGRNAGQRKVEPSKGLAIGVIGAKGGVGTTTIALNVAAVFALMNEHPVVADYRLGAGSMSLMLGVMRTQGMANVLSKSTAEIRPRTIEEELVTHQSGLRALLSSPRAKEAQLNYTLDSAVAVARSLRTVGRPSVVDLGSMLTPTISRVQREMDQMVVVVEPTSIGMSMTRELLQELDAGRSGATRVHLVVVNRFQSTMQTPWHEVEQFLNQEIRAIISPAPELAFQAANAGTPMVMFQPNAVFSSQLAKLAQDLKVRVQGLTSGEMTKQ